MELKIAKYLFQHTKSNTWHLERNKDNWLLYINNHQVLKTARGQKKEYKTVEAALKDIEQITGKKINTLTAQRKEQQGELLE